MEPLDYRLYPSQLLPPELRRIGQEIVAQARHELLETENRHEGLHNARKLFKMMRALLRLSRVGLGEEAFKAENKLYRNLGRRLSELRDATARIETLDRLQTSGKISPEWIAKVRDVLEKQRTTISQKHLDSGERDREVAKRLTYQSRRIADWPLILPKKQEAFFYLIRPGLAYTYDQGRKAMHAAYKENTSEAFHEWRKRVKYLRHQIELLQLIWPDITAVWLVNFEKLSDLLGEDHDLYVLDQVLDEAALDPKEWERWKKVRRKQSKVYRRAAWPLGQRLYAESGEGFTDRFNTYWIVQRQIERKKK